MSGDSGFVQIIELVTHRPDDVQALVEGWAAATEGRRSAQRGTMTRDRDRADTYVQIVEFPDYESAMANSSLPETAGFAEQLGKLCDAPPTFTNLDVIRVVDL